MIIWVLNSTITNIYYHVNQMSLTYRKIFSFQFLIEMIFLSNHFEICLFVWFLCFFLSSTSVLVYSGFLDNSFLRLFSRSTQSMMAKFCDATYAWSNEISVLTKATGADRMAATLSNDSPRTVEEIWGIVLESQQVKEKRKFLVSNTSKCSLIKEFCRSSAHDLFSPHALKPMPFYYSAWDEKCLFWHFYIWPLGAP